ncbi:DUF4236 domain-containing protein [Nodosilinea sp. E11]|uniref:DUF4236 domain-containing protein n=1 Tax=Nodosilinea sp. E11 TaxID=3037479 RepID=UPI002934F6CC|nr:DUF4236 domain-containing protein [Nodosilinea sp. E11]
MGFRFRKKIKLLPGLSLNLSKSGISTSLKAGAVSWNSRTQKTSVNLPGPFSYHTNPGLLKKSDLVELAKHHNLKGYSKLNKQELIELLRQNGISM